MGKIKSFLNSNYFIAIIYAITIALWWYNLPIISMVLYVSLAILIIITNTKRITLVTLIFAAIIAFKSTGLSKTAPIITISVAAVLPFLLFDIFKTKLILKNKILIAMLFFLAANVFSMLNLTSDTASYGILGVGQTFAFVMIIFYFSNRKNDKDYHYVSKNAMFLGLAIAIEFLIYAITYDGDLMGKDIKLGWGMSNSIAMIVTLMVPLTYSLYVTNQKNKFALFVVVVELIVILLMMSKGAYIALVIMAPIMVIISYKRVESKKKLLIDQFFAVAILVVILFGVFQVESLREGFASYFDRMGDRGWFVDDSRIEIYKYALEIFKRFPLFGSGSYTGVPYLVEKGYQPSLLHYHNIFLHSLATLGIFGFGSFIYFLYVSIKSTLVDNTYNLFTFTAIVAMVVHGMVDNTWYNPLVMICILTALSVIERGKKQSSED